MENRKKEYGRSNECIWNRNKDRFSLWRFHCSLCHLSTRIESGLLDETNVKCLHNVLDGSQSKPASDTVIFKTVGMALVDLVAAEYICETAEREGIGAEVEF